MKEIKLQYGFPLFVKSSSTGYMLKAEKIRVSDIWALWHYIVKTEKKKNSSTTDLPFLISVLEQAQYFFEAASDAPIKSQPLLYYYSFLNLAKAAIVINNYGLLVLNKEFNHGIDSSPINTNTKLNETSVIIKNLTNPDGAKQKISVAYELARFFEDSIEFRNAPILANHDNGPWKLQFISLLKSCVGIHRTVSETLKSPETFVHIDNIGLKKEGIHLFFEASLNTTPIVRNALITAGYILEERPSNWILKETRNMSNQNLNKSEFKNFSISLIKKGLWSYSTGEEFKYYINSNRLTKEPDGVYRLNAFNANVPGVQHITLSSATIIYYIMFFLGSITRYHPYLFEKILNEKEIWMVSEFLKTQPLQFLLLLTSKVIGKPLYTSQMPFPV